MQASELVLNSDGSIYHLGLNPNQIGDYIITVGDPQRVEMVSRHFDKIIIRKVSREFVTHCGYIKNKKITVISTGIGTDNIDIVLNEIDALVNVDLKTRTVKDQLKSLDIIRIGTTGSLRKEIKVDTFIESKFAIGLDGLQQFYLYQSDSEEQELYNNVNQCLKENGFVMPFYTAKAGTQLDLDGIIKGITITSPGFYAPQSRHIRLKPRFNNFFDPLSSLNHKDIPISNLEMETAGIFSLANLLGHKATSLNAVLANRITKEFSTKPRKTVELLIEKVIDYLRG